MILLKGLDPFGSGSTTMAWSLEFALFGLDKEAGLITWVPGTTPFGHATLLIMSDPDFALQVVSDPDPDGSVLKSTPYKNPKKSLKN